MTSTAARWPRFSGALGAALTIAVATAIVTSGAGLLGAGGSLARASTTTGAGSGPSQDLPPRNRDELAKIFDPLLRPLGLHTTRASVQRQIQYGGRYRVGNHFAIYVEPIDPKGVSRRRTIDTIMPVAQIFLPVVFRRWSDLDSFDVCQEPAADADPSAAPPPLTQVAAKRKGAAKVEWASASLSDLIAKAAAAGGDNEYGLGDPASLYLFVAPELTDVPAYRRARVAAGLPATSPTTTTTLATATKPGG